MNNIYHITQILGMRPVQYTERSYAIKVTLNPDAIPCEPSRMSKANAYDRYYRIVEDRTVGRVALEFLQGDTVTSLISRVSDEGYAANDNEAFDEACGVIEDHIRDFKEWEQDYMHDVNNYHIVGTNLTILEKEVGSANTETLTVEVRESNTAGSRPAGTYNFDVVVGRFGHPTPPWVEQARAVCAGIKAYMREVDKVEDFGMITFMGVEYNGNWNML